MSNTRTAGGKTPWLLLILLVLIGAGGSAAGMYFLLGNQAAAGSAPAAVEPEQEPIFLPISPFTVNLRSEQREQRLLYIGLSLQLEDKASEQFLKQYMPQVRSRLLTLLASKTAAELLTPDGKAQLSASILEQLRAPMAPQQPELRVSAVLYTDFIVQ